MAIVVARSKVCCRAWQLLYVAEDANKKIVGYVLAKMEEDAAGAHPFLHHAD